MSLYGTALGSVTPAAPPAGTAPAGVYNTVQPVTVSLGGQSISASFAGLAPGFVGVYQVNFRVPSSVAGGTQSLTISQEGRVSRAVQIAITR